MESPHTRPRSLPFPSTGSFQPFRRLRNRSRRHLHASRLGLARHVFPDRTERNRFLLPRAVRHRSCALFNASGFVQGPWIPSVGASTACFRSRGRSNVRKRRNGCSSPSRASGTPPFRGKRRTPSGSTANHFRGVLPGCRQSRNEPLGGTGIVRECGLRRTLRQGEMVSGALGRSPSLEARRCPSRLARQGGLPISTPCFVPWNPSRVCPRFGRPRMAYRFRVP